MKEIEDVYGSWMVIDGPIRGPNRRVVWLCRCICGKEKLVYEYNLVSGKSSSCAACARRGKKLGLQVDTSEFSKRFTHVLPKVRTKLRQAAWAAIARCTDENDPRYADYGGRGIQVWFTDKVEFFEYLLTLPGHDDFSLVIDRIDNDKHYEPGNLRFVTRSVSQRNQRPRKRRHYHH